MNVVEVKSPDGWICEIIQSADGSFSPVRWKDGQDSGVPRAASDPSPGIREHAFPTAKEAMMAAWRERLHRDYLRRNLTPKTPSK
jgi:hypothetical protein